MTICSLAKHEGNANSVRYLWRILQEKTTRVCQLPSVWRPIKAAVKLDHRLIFLTPWSFFLSFFLSSFEKRRSKKGDGKTKFSSRILFDISPRKLRYLPVRLEGPSKFLIIRNEYYCVGSMLPRASRSLDYAWEIVFHPSQLETFVRATLRRLFLICQLPGYFYYWRHVGDNLHLENYWEIVTVSDDSSSKNA